MGQDSDTTPYVPDVVPESDRAYYENEGRYGNRVGWGERPAVLVVDMTLAFTSEAPAVAEDCIASTERLLAAARDADVPVYYATPNPAGSYYDGYPVTTKASPASDRGPDRTGSDGDGDGDEDDGGRAEWLSNLDTIVPELEPEEGEPVVTKSRASAFFDTHLGNLLRHRGIDTLVVCGMTTSGCIRATVVDSHSSNFRAIVPEECVADPSGVSHEVCLFDVDMKFGDVTSLSAVVERLGAR